MNNDASVTFRLPAADRAALERAAKLEDRPITGLVRRIIAEWLRAQAKRAAR
jgi:uncharacterized protein (DUF1778 family)